jgi:hypothetical protein
MIDDKENSRLQYLAQILIDLTLIHLELLVRWLKNLVMQIFLVRGVDIQLKKTINLLASGCIIRSKH